MLKITHDTGRGSAAILKLEGQVAGRWVQELRHAFCESRRRSRQPTTLDLKDVTFIDSDCLAFFEEVGTHIRLINCSLFATEQLKDVLARSGKVQ